MQWQLWGTDPTKRQWEDVVVIERLTCLGHVKSHHKKLQKKSCPGEFLLALHCVIPGINCETVNPVSILLSACCF